MCVMHVWTIYMQNFKSIVSKMAFIPSKSFENVHRRNFQIRFFDQVMKHRKMKMAPLNSP